MERCKDKCGRQVEEDADWTRMGCQEEDVHVAGIKASPLPVPCQAMGANLRPYYFLPSLPSTRGRDWTVVTVVTIVPSGMMVRSNSIFLVGVMLGRGVEEVGVPRFRGEPCS